MARTMIKSILFAILTIICILCSIFYSVCSILAINVLSDGGNIEYMVFSIFFIGSAIFMFFVGFLCFQEITGSNED